MVDNPNHKRDYTKIPHSVSRCKSLDYISRGILVFMLSHQQKWGHTMKELQEMIEPSKRLTKATIFRKAMHQLEKAGHAQREYIREGGRIRTTTWHFSANPIPETERSKPLKDKTQPNVHLLNVSKLDSSILNVSKPLNNRRHMNGEDHEERRVGFEGRKTYESPAPSGLNDDDLQCLQDHE